MDGLFWVSTARLHEPVLAANPGPPFSSQTLVTVQAFDWKKVNPG